MLVTGVSVSLEQYIQYLVNILSKFWMNKSINEYEKSYTFWLKFHLQVRKTEESEFEGTIVWKKNKRFLFTIYQVQFTLLSFIHLTFLCKSI